MHVAATLLGKPLTNTPAPPFMAYSPVASRSCCSADLKHAPPLCLWARSLQLKYVTYPPAGEEGIAHKLQVEAEKQKSGSNEQ